MTRQPGTRELGLFTASDKRRQPRDMRGRFVRVRHSAERVKILETARKLRAGLKLTPLDALLPFEGKTHD